MRGKSTLQDADVSGKMGVDRFDLKSWQGLTEVLKVGKESLNPDIYAEFRNLVLQYAQHGGDAEFKKRIDDVIETFGKPEVTEVPAEPEVTIVPAEDLGAVEAVIEMESPKSTINPIGLRRSVQPQFDVTPQSVVEEKEKTTESEDISEVKLTPELPHELDKEKTEFSESKLVHEKKETVAHEPKEPQAEMLVPEIPIPTEDEKHPEPMPEPIVELNIPAQSIPVVSSSPAISVETEMPSPLPGIVVEHENVLPPEPPQSEPTQVPVEEPLVAPTPQEKATLESTPIVPTPIQEPMKSIEVIPDVIVPEAVKSVTTIPPAPAEKLETDDIKRYANLDDCKKRIAEIKRSVNVHYGNPVALMGVQGGAGKTYMTALLTALKAVGPGANFGVDEAMDALEKAFLTLMKGGASAPEETHEAEKTTSPIPTPPVPETPREVVSMPTPVPEPVSIPVPPTLVLEIEKEVQSVPHPEITIQEEQPDAIPDVIMPPVSVPDSEMSVETPTARTIPVVSSSIPHTPAQMLGIDTEQQSEPTPIIPVAVLPQTEIEENVTPIPEPESVAPPVSILSVIEPLPEIEPPQELKPELEPPVTESVEQTPVVAPSILVNDPIEEPIFVPTPVPEMKTAEHAESKQEAQIEKPVTPRFIPPTPLSVLIKEVPQTPVSGSEVKVAEELSVAVPSAPKMKEVKLVSRTPITERVVEEDAPKQVTERYKFVPPPQEPELSERALSMQASFDTTDDTISAVLGSVQKSLEPLEADSVIELTKNEPSGYDNWSAHVDAVLDAPIPKMPENPQGALPPRENKWVKKGIATTSDPQTLQEEHGIDTSVILVQQTELSLPEITTALNSLLEKWGVFSGSGIFGMGPGGLEHPLYQKLSNLTMGEVMAGRWDEATPKTLKIIKQYIDAWRHEQGITYTDNETFDHYLRRVVQRILKRQNG